MKTMYIESIGGSVGTLHEAINWTGLGLGIGLGIGPGEWNETVTRQTVTELASRSGFILSYHVSVGIRVFTIKATSREFLLETTRAGFQTATIEVAKMITGATLPLL